jgi:hypothetical protein
MCCIAEIAMFILGTVALVKGQFKLTASRWSGAGRPGWPASSSCCR